MNATGKTWQPVTVHGLYAGNVVIEDGDEVHLIPLSTVSAINTAIDAGEVVELDSCPECIDGPAYVTDDRSRPRCYAHAADSPTVVTYTGFGLTRDTRPGDLGRTS